MKITEFFKTDYVDYSSYDNLRKIASLVDGQKNGSRKILYTILEKKIKDKIKVSQLASKVAEFSEYLHGSLDDVIVNLGQDYVGTNNIPLLQKKGNFGTRFSPDASASRYIYTYGSAEFFDMFKTEDSPVLKHQSFEGAQIEPMFFVPKLPVLLINGSEGVSSGFAQKILPRDPKILKKYIKEHIKGKIQPKTLAGLKPFYEGFGGTIEQGEIPSQWLIKGKVERVSINRVKITEVPVGFSLKSYLKVLDTLEDKNIIQSYRDKSEDDDFSFEVNIQSKVLKTWSDTELLEKLKLVKKVTENYTVINENNKIDVCESVQEILNKYIEVKKQYLLLRKNHLIQKITDDIRLDFSRYFFIKLIVDGSLIINKRKKIDIIKDLEKIEKITTRDDSYDYLLNLSIMSLTEERMEKLGADIKSSKVFLDELQKKSAEDLWNDEL